MKIRILFVVSLVLVACWARGQEPLADQAPTAGVDSAEPEKKDTKKDTHTAAVEEFFAVMKMKETSDKTIDQMLAMQVRQQPQLAEFKDVMTAFLRKHVSYDALKDELVKLYKSEFTEHEIRTMSEFYRTPVGQKAVSKLPLLTATGATLGMQRVQANMAELQQAITKRRAELENR